MPERKTPAGPGRFSKRTDKDQPIQTPRLEDPDVKFGDIQKIEDAQRIQPVPGGQAQGVSESRFSPSAAGELPGFLFEQPTAFPAEPGSAGLDQGPGPGPEVLQSPPEPEDDREAVLFFLATAMQNPDAAEMLQEYRASRAERNAAESSPLMEEPTLESPVDAVLESPEEEGELSEDIFAVEEEAPMPEEEGAPVELGPEDTVPSPTPETEPGASPVPIEEA